MSDEFQHDIGKKVKVFLKIGRKYEGEIKEVSKNNFIQISDKFNKPVKISGENIAVVEYE